MQHFPLLGSVFRSSLKKNEQNVPSSGLSVGYSVGSIENTSNKGSIARKNSMTSATATTTKKNRKTLLSPLKKSTTSIIPNKIDNYNPRIGSPTKSTDDAPKAFYRNFLPPTAPPSISDYIQLKELLDKLRLSQDSNNVLSLYDSYESIFLEVIRQYFIESSSQGRLLDKCRLFYFSLCKSIPKLKTRFENDLRRLQQRIEENNQIIESVKKDMIPSEDRKNHLSSLISELKDEQQLLVKHMDGVTTTLAQTSKEVDDLKVAATQLDSRIAEKNQKLIKLNDDLRTLDGVSAKCTADTVSVADYLRSVLNQIDINKTKIENEKKHIERFELSLSTINMEIEEIKNSFNQTITYVEHNDSSVQADLMVKTQKSSVIEKAKELREQQETAKSMPLAFAFHSLTKSGKFSIPKDGIQVSTYEEFASLKHLLLEHSSKFQMDKESINNAESGDFTLKEAPNDYIRLFSTKLTSSILDSSNRKVPLTEIGSQTLNRIVAISQKPSEMLLSAVSTEDKFIRMIPVDYSQREPKSLLWMINSIRMIYDSKYTSDMKSIQNEDKLRPLNQFIIEFAKKNHSLEFLAYQFCWDINNTGIFYKGLNGEIDLFMQALYEYIDVEQLCFMLICRDSIIKSGSVVSLKLEDQSEQITEYYLNQDQLKVLLQKWWKDRFDIRVYNKVMEHAISRPAVHLEAIKRYVSMNDILKVTVGQYKLDLTHQIQELLMKTRIVPRISREDFRKLLLSLLPTLSDEDISKFYRITVIKNLHRLDVSEDEFAIKFRQGSLLLVRNEKPENDIRQEELMETIKDQWNTKKDELSQMVNFFDQFSKEHNDNIGLRALVIECQRHLSMLTHSISSNISSDACYDYFHLLFSLDLLFCNLPTPSLENNESTLVSLECSIKEYWLDSVFDHVPSN